MRHHAADQGGIAAFEAVIDRVEPTIEQVPPFRRYRRTQPKCALRRLECHRVNRAEQRRCRYHERKLRYMRPVKPGKNAAGKNTDISTSVMPMMGPTVRSWRGWPRHARSCLFQYCERRPRRR